MTNRNAQPVSPPPMPSKSGAPPVTVRLSARELAHEAVQHCPYPASYHNGRCDRLTAAIEARDREAEMMEAGLRAEVETVTRQLQTLLDQGEAEHEAYETMKAKVTALVAEQSAELATVQAFLTESPRTERVEPEHGETWEAWDMCLHCGCAEEDCEADGKCWGARVRIFLAARAGTPGGDERAMTTRGGQRERTGL